jgi:hypothetical protein
LQRSAVDVDGGGLHDRKSRTWICFQCIDGFPDETGEDYIVILQDAQIRTSVNLDGPIPIAKQTDIALVLE